MQNKIHAEQATYVFIHNPLFPDALETFRRLRASVSAIVKREKRRLQSARSKASYTPDWSTLSKAISSDLKRSRRRKQIQNRQGPQLTPSAFTMFMGSKSKNSPPIAPARFQLPKEFKSLLLEAIITGKTGKAVGPDRIHVEMLQCSPNECAELLASIWETCGRLSIYPKQWQQGVLVPIHKKGPQMSPANYRPICLLSHARKMVESALTSIVSLEFTPHHNQFGFRTHQSIDSALLLANHCTKQESKHIAILDLSQAYDSVDRRLLLQECRSQLSRNTVAMIQSSLCPSILTTAGDVTNTSADCTIGVPQGSTLSPSLFNIFIDPLVRTLHPSNDPSAIPSSALLADDVIIYARLRRLLQDKLDNCTSWAATNNMTWNPKKCFVILQEDTLQCNSDMHQQPLSIAASPLTEKKTQEYLGVTLSSNGIQTERNVERAQAASPILQFLFLNKHFKTNTTLRHTSWILTTFLRSKYTYALHHMPLLTSLLEKDTLIERKLFKSALNLRKLPTSQQVSNIRGLLRVPALQMVRNIMSHNLARKVHFRLESSDLVTRQLAQRDKNIILQRSPYDHLRIAFNNPQTLQQLTHAKFCAWNSSREGIRQPHFYQKSHWSPALCLPTNNKRIPIMAIRWHMGIFPIPNPILRQQPRYSHYQTQLLLLQKSRITKTEQHSIISAITWFLHQQRNTHSNYNEDDSVLHTTS